MSAGSMGQRLERKRKVRRKRIAIGAIFLLFIALVAAASFYFFDNDFSKAKPATSEGSGQKVNILVLGVDERDDDVGRSDTTLLLTVDSKEKQASLLSIPRDSRVKIPGHGYDKINAAYAYGGHRLSEQTVADFVGVPVDYYLLINFAAFDKIVDAIGGVDINVEKRMHYEDPYDKLVIDLKPGMQHLDGKTAIQYVRYRDEEGDIGRVGRQQKFMKAILDQVTSPMVIPRIPGIIAEVASAVKTDLTIGDMMNLAKILNEVHKQGLHTEMVSGKPAYIQDISYWLPDVVSVRQYMARVMGIFDSKYLATAEKTATEYTEAVPKEMKIVDLPKTQPAQSAPKPKDAVSKPVMAPVSKVRVEIVNSSGVSSTGAKIAAIMREQGFEVSSITQGTPTANTVVISHTNNSAVVDKLNSLGFRCAVQVKRDENSNSITVIVGKDNN
ncbi:LCP family protein required for cell wall assembly [Sporomusaceae bacterium BoRhaA]|uniref:LCP family protein n=1 Tax=Pelorhabdus rhamnosifermentans TaxID=2772457 RepID=UPI001FE2B402|nr:LCP family protein [Pelorhabdus rhamnosifermentans]MBU2702512.1 LCP family protein required for cell wall assembly [Pelorhabdus rhamnosifermentans]